LTFRRFTTCVISICVALGLRSAGLAQDQSAQTPPPTAPAAIPQKPAEPDYPDPRTVTLGIFYWVTGPGTNPGIFGGRQALDFGTLPDLGKPHRSPGAEISLPISRTGSLHGEYFQTKGDTNVITTAAPDLFGIPFTNGDALSTQFQIKSGKFYLDDLLYPHKFPVARFRLKSLWGVQYTKANAVIDKPSVAGQTAAGSKQVILPSLGLAAEYAIAPHVLFRIDGSGFGLYHKADQWDASATLSWRRGQWEIVAGGKAFHFKTSPNKDEYLMATLAGAFVGIRWHWNR
jgi:hypothetical protein